MRQHLQPVLIAYKILQVIQDENSDPLFRNRDLVELRLERFENGGKSMLLNQEQQAFFGFAVVIQPCQRHASGAGKITHGGAFISFEAEDLRGMFQYMFEAAIETGRGHVSGRSARSVDLTA